MPKQSSSIVGHTEEANELAELLFGCCSSSDEDDDDLAETGIRRPDLDGRLGPEEKVTPYSGPASPVISSPISKQFESPGHRSPSPSGPGLGPTSSHCSDRTECPVRGAPCDDDLRSQLLTASTTSTRNYDSIISSSPNLMSPTTAGDVTDDVTVLDGFPRGPSPGVPNSSSSPLKPSPPDAPSPFIDLPDRVHEEIEDSASPPLVPYQSAGEQCDEGSKQIGGDSATFSRPPPSLKMEDFVLRLQLPGRKSILESLLNGVPIESRAMLVLRGSENTHRVDPADPVDDIATGTIPSGSIQSSCEQHEMSGCADALPADANRIPEPTLGEMPLDGDNNDDDSNDTEYSEFYEIDENSNISEIITTIRAPVERLQSESFLLENQLNPIVDKADPAVSDNQPLIDSDDEFIIWPSSSGAIEHGFGDGSFSESDDFDNDKARNNNFVAKQFDILLVRCDHLISSDCAGSSSKDVEDTLVDHGDSLGSGWSDRTTGGTATAIDNLETMTAGSRRTRRSRSGSLVPLGGFGSSHTTWNSLQICPPAPSPELGLPGDCSAEIYLNETVSHIEPGCSDEIRSGISANRIQDKPIVPELLDGGMTVDKDCRSVTSVQGQQKFSGTRSGKLLKRRNETLPDDDIGEPMLKSVRRSRQRIVSDSDDDDEIPGTIVGDNRPSDRNNSGCTHGTVCDNNSSINNNNNSINYNNNKTATRNFNNDLDGLIAGGIASVESEFEMDWGDHTTDLGGPIAVAGTGRVDSVLGNCQPGSAGISAAGDASSHGSGPGGHRIELEISGPETPSSLLLPCSRGINFGLRPNDAGSGKESVTGDKCSRGAGRPADAGVNRRRLNRSDFYLNPIPIPSCSNVQNNIPNRLPYHRHDSPAMTSSNPRAGSIVSNRSSCGSHCSCCCTVSGGGRRSSGTSGAERRRSKAGNYADSSSSHCKLRLAGGSKVVSYSGYRGLSHGSLESGRRQCHHRVISPGAGSSGGPSFGGSNWSAGCLNWDHPRRRRTESARSKDHATGRMHDKSACQRRLPNSEESAAELAAKRRKEHARHSRKDRDQRRMWTLKKKNRQMKDLIEGFQSQFEAMRSDMTELRCQVIGKSVEEVDRESNGGKKQSTRSDKAELR